MTKIEIKEVGVKSAFKATIFISSIPLAFMSVIGIILTIIGVSSGNSVVFAMGIPYIIMPVFMIVLYGLISMLIALVYNTFSKKFGGLELVITEKKENH